MQNMSNPIIEFGKFMVFHKKVMWGIFLISSLATMSGCSSSDEKTTDVVKVAVPTEEFAPADSFFTACSYVMLEDKDNVLIGGGAKYEVTSDYILSYSHDGGFNLFGIDGRHISSISNYGEGPNEYLEITDFVLTDFRIKGNRLYAIERISRPIQPISISHFQTD